jgi:hypothetical protein
MRHYRSNRRLVLVVPPRIIFLLLIGMAFPKIPVIAMRFTFPPRIEHYLVVVPHMVIVVVAVVNAVTGTDARPATGEYQG